MKQQLFTAFVVGLGLTASIWAQVPSYVPTNGLVGWWPFNGNANDESGNGNNGTVNGATLTTDRFGTANKAYSFDGNDFIQKSSFQLTGSSPRTIIFWFKKTLSNPDGTPVSWGINSQGQRFDCGISNTGVSAGAFNSAKIFSYNGVATNWNMYTVVVPNITNPSVNNIIIYENGIQLSNVSSTFNGTTLINTASNSTLFFGRNNGAGNQSFLIGLLDDIGIWNRVLTQQEIIDLYNSISCANDLSISPNQNTLQTGNTSIFTATTSDANPTYIWQSDFGQGFQTLNNIGNYSGTTTSILSISNIQLANHNQPIRAISTTANCSDTSNVTTIQIADTCITNVTVYDTLITNIYDTTIITVYDTLLTTVTDTLIINTTLSLPAPNNENTILIYPNPASDHITIDNGNFAAMAGYSIKIENNSGQQVFQSAINQAQFYVDLSTWTGNGMYFVHLIDAQGNTVTVRKIVLQ